MNRKTVSALLAAALLTAAFIGCSSGNNAGKDINDGTAAVTTGTPAADTGAVKDQLLATMDFGGADVIFHTRGDEDSVVEIFVEADNTGDRINQAVYNRNQLVNERLNVNIKQYSDFGWESYHESLNSLRAALASGESPYDVVAGWSAKIPNMMTYGLFLDLKDVKNLYLEEPWWSQMINEACDVNDKLYFATGDIATSYTNTCYTYTFNRRMLADYAGILGEADLYQTVRDGNWTIDYVDAMTKKIHTDVNNNGEMDANDIFGMTIDAVNAMDAHLQGFEVSLLSRDETGRYFMDADLEQLDSIVQKMYALLYDNEGVGYANEANYSTGPAFVAQCFKNGNALLHPTTFWDIMQHYGDMEDEYGVLPYPKWDTDQKEYATRLSDGLALFSIPVSAKDSDMSGAVMEAMASESYRSVTIEVYERVLKNRYTSDDDSKDMMDLINKNKYVNFEIIYNESFWCPWYMLRETVFKGNNNFASWWDDNNSKFNMMLSDLMDIFFE